MHKRNVLEQLKRHILQDLIIYAWVISYVYCEDRVVLIDTPALHESFKLIVLELVVRQIDRLNVTVKLKTALQAVQELVAQFVEAQVYLTKAFFVLDLVLLELMHESHLVLVAVCLAGWTLSWRIVFLLCDVVPVWKVVNGHSKLAERRVIRSRSIHTSG